MRKSLAFKVTRPDGARSPPALLVLIEFRWSAHMHVVGLGTSAAFAGARADQLALELGKSAEHVE